MHKWILIIVFSILFSDSTDTVHKKFNWKLNFIPFLGQIKNERYIKGGVLAALQGYSFYKFSDYNENDQISMRNTYAWWLLGLYFYGVVDAYVDYSLNNFPKTDQNKDKDIE